MDTRLDKGDQEIREGRRIPDEVTGSIISGTFKHSSLPSAIKEFVRAGDKPEDILMRTVLDDRTGTAVPMFMERCIDCEDEVHLNLVLHWMAAQVSRKGRGRDDLLQAVVGQLKQAAKLLGKKTDGDKPDNV